ncbi:MAG: MBL fold metallo-hydrolase [Deltaproteobacteria bacterium]|nr:MBL fold metallo-hydrolase [Deltaproteobacteria bacterium]
MIKKITIGDVEIYRIVEMEGPILGVFELFPDATEDIIKNHQRWMVPRFYEPDSKLLRIAIQGFLLKTPRHTILVDTCSGALKKRKRPIFNMQNWPWLETLSASGVLPQGIDTVVCTHLNVDHVGWNTVWREDHWQPTFPNAQYIISKSDYQYWDQLAGQNHLPRTGDYIEDSVHPVYDSGKLELVDDNHIIEESIRLESIPGHSPGQVAVHINSKGEKAVIGSDVIHHPLQCLYPEWSTNFCVDKTKSRKTRREFLEKYADSDILCLPSHFPSPTAVFFERNGSLFNFRYKGDTESIIPKDSFMI